MISAGIDSDYCDGTSLQAMFFSEHAVVVIGEVCVQKLKILINAGTSQSVLSTPKDLLQICTGQNNIYHNSIVWNLSTKPGVHIFNSVVI